MSSNLLKRGFTQLVEEDARVINTNDLVAKRIRELAAKMQQDEGTGFISGLAADKVEALVTDTGDGEENPQTSGNVIKAGEDLQKLKEEAEAEAQQIIEHRHKHRKQTHWSRPEGRDSRKRKRRLNAQRPREQRNIRKKLPDWMRNIRREWMNWSPSS